MTTTSGLRICVASTGLGHVTRGAESWASYLGSALAERGEQVILCKGGGTVDADHERVIRCWTRDSTRTRRLLRMMPHGIAWRLGIGSAYGVEQSTFAWRLLNTLRRERIDVLHVMDPIAAMLIQNASRAGLCSTRTVLNHGTEECVDFQSRFLYLQHVAPWHRQQAESAGIWRDSWTMIPNFVDTVRYCPGQSTAIRRELSLPIDATIVLVSSAIKSKHKRVDYLIEEFELAHRSHPELPIWLVVAGGREPETEALIERGSERLGDRVRFLVNFPSHRMPELYRAANLLVHGSLKEMLGIALLEAIASGVPCIVHQHPVMQWVIGGGGMSLDLSVRGNLADAMVKLASDRTAMARLAVEARTHCCRLFSKEVVVDQILEYYGRISRCTRMAA